MLTDCKDIMPNTRLLACVDITIAIKYPNVRTVHCDSDVLASL